MGDGSFGGKVILWPGLCSFYSSLRDKCLVSEEEVMLVNIT